MASVALRSALPEPLYQEVMDDLADEPLYPSISHAEKVNRLVPPYGQREGFVPRIKEDYGDGGAFPEIHVAQYPLDMGRKSKSNVGSGQLVALSTGEDGSIQYDAIVRHGRRKEMVVFGGIKAQKEKFYGEDDLARPTDEEEDQTVKETKAQLEALMNRKTAGSNPISQAQAAAESKVKYIRYTPAGQNSEHNSGATSRVIKMVDMPVDPMEPPKFKHVKMPGAPGTPPVPVMHSPSRKLTKEERDAWKIPPSISNWKNNKGYIIPLDKRLAADGRHLQEHTVSDSFAKLSEALYIAERNAREEVAKRQAVYKQIEIQKQQAREEELRQVAQKAREQRMAIREEAMETETREERLARIERERVRDDRRRERERQWNLSHRGQALKAAMKQPTRSRDISEKIALGQAVATSQESMYDQRLFNQSAGMDSGFGDEEDYNIYDSRLFGGDRERALYKAPSKEESELYGEQQSLESIVSTDRFKPHKDFSGVDRSVKEAREGPVQYERDEKKEDEWGLEEFLHEAKAKTKKSDAPSSGVMHAAGGGADLQSAGRGNRKIGFAEGEVEGGLTLMKPDGERPRVDRSGGDDRDRRWWRDRDGGDRRSRSPRRSGSSYRDDRDRDRDRERDRERDRPSRRRSRSRSRSRSPRGDHKRARR